MPKNITFATLVKKYDFNDISPLLVEFYPDQKKNLPGYKKAYEKLRKIKPAKSSLSILLEVLKLYEEEPYINVSGIAKGEEIRYGLDFYPWKKCLGSKILNKINNDYTDEFSEKEIVCHVLWEITWHGWEEPEIVAKLKKVEKMADEVIKNKSFHK